MVSIDKSVFFNDGLLEIVQMQEIDGLCNDLDEGKERDPKQTYNVSCNMDMLATVKFCEQVCSGDRFVSDECMTNLHYSTDDQVKEFFTFMHESNGLNINCPHFLVAFDEIGTPGLEIEQNIKDSLEYKRAHDAWHQVIRKTLVDTL